jgi:hypothetical protein
MNIYVKSRGNLRKQDYLYWLDEYSSSSNDEILNRSVLIDDKNPGLLLFYQDRYYHLLVSSLDSARREPSSPCPIRNFIFFTKIQEEEAIFLTKYALQHWEKLAEDVDGAIQVDDSVYGYKFDRGQLKVINDLASDRNDNSDPRYRSDSKKNLTNYIAAYGEIGSDEWKDVANKLDKYTLSKHKNSIVLLVTKYQSFHSNYYPLTLLGDRKQGSLLFKKYSLSLNNCSSVKKLKDFTGELIENLNPKARTSDYSSDLPSSKREKDRNHDKNEDDT